MELLRVLSDTPGVSGFEDRVLDVVKAELELVCDAVRVDKIGNVIGVKSSVRSEQGQAPLKVMLAAHMDEIGLMVKHLVRFLIQLAEEKGIRTQINLGGGTDAAIIQRHRTGARVCTIGPPTRYMHSTVQLCSKEDIESTVQLLVAFLHNAHKGELG